MSRVLIVGAGLTGSLCAYVLKRVLQSKAQFVVWDKARGAGGRMSTSRPPDPTSHSADLGAQYITATAAYSQSHSNFYTELLSAGLLKSLDCHIEGLQHKEGNKNYVTPLGTSSVVKHFLSESGADLYLEYHVTGLRRCGASWKVERKGGNEKFDAVVLTIPVPQILQLQGDLGNYTPGLGPSLVVHTSVPFGLEHLENDKDAIQPIILQELQRLLPDLPQPVSIKFQKWRYSQVLTSVPNCPGHMTILEQPLLICGGDAFTHSNFDGCVESALSVCRALQLLLDVKQNISL
ncbi:renalase isoform X2 [Xiphophorus couchianus]|uniref:renalase isoform X2 n=1 Tax=Xiphophorus couchianus TaxID=32473 RepID=UPI001015F253|nr:renalase isoform X2 [Xiphophorus couchianus]